ncbi:MAG: chaperone protein DnaK [Candidatus Dojkabacteria bacterium]|nr:MAG: chaperone protein DnaK [Candidatus Dojkabacteria bacterium]
MSRIIGIDLGTTNSCMAVNQTVGGPKVIPNAEGANTTPSVVAWSNGERIVGIAAKNQSVLNPKNTLYSVKRLIGRKYSDPEVQRDIKLLPYDIREAKNGGVEVKFGEEWLPPEAISAMVLQKLKADAEKFLGEPVTRAVITVPAYFDDAQRQATKNAGKIAGLEVERIINEPTAAALAYGLDKKKDETIVVYDLGGGTFDVTVLEIGDGVFEVKATNGDTHLGGDDFDQRIINYLNEEFKKANGIDLKEDTAALQRLKEAAEKAKIELSTLTQTQVNIPYITADKTGPKHLNVTLTRAKLEELVSDLLEATLEPVRKALADAGKSVADIDEVVLVGGMTRMPKVQQIVKEFFGKEPHAGVNPDEVVAIGAAIQAGVLQGDVHDITLLDVTPLSLGVETEGGIMTKIIERNTTIPVEKKQIFSTAADNQPSVEIVILQGERPMAADNKVLGRFILDGIRPAPRGVPRIEVTFDIDANGILKVTAKDLDTGKELSQTVKATTNLTEDEIDKMIKEAEKYAEEDKKKKELAEARNDAESAISAIERLKSENKDKLTEEHSKELDTHVQKLKDLLSHSAPSIADLKSAAEDAQKTAYNIAAQLASQSSPQTDKANGSESKTDGSDQNNEVKEGEVVK